MFYVKNKVCPTHEKDIINIITRENSQLLQKKGSQSCNPIKIFKNNVKTIKKAQH